VMAAARQVLDIIAANAEGFDDATTNASDKARPPSLIWRHQRLTSNASDKVGRAPAPAVPCRARARARARAA
jgi:hypothetical protein